MSELCLESRKSIQKKDQTGLYNQMTHVGSILEIYLMTLIFNPEYFNKLQYILNMVVF